MARRYRRHAANRGAHCVARKRVYSRALHRHVLRCAKFSGGRVGVRKRPLPGPFSRRCARRKKVWSRALRKKVLRCAKFGPRPVRSPFLLGPGRSQPDVVVSSSGAVITPPSPVPAWVVPVVPERLLLLPPNAKSLANRERVLRRLSKQMKTLQSSQQTMARWPGDRPKARS